MIPGSASATAGQNENSSSHGSKFNEAYNNQDEAEDLYADNEDSDEDEFSFGLEDMCLMDDLAALKDNIADYREDLLDHQLYQVEQDELHANSNGVETSWASGVDTQCDKLGEESGQESDKDINATSDEENGDESTEYENELSEGDESDYSNAPKRRHRTQLRPQRKRRRLSLTPAASPPPYLSASSTAQLQSHIYGGVSCSCTYELHAVDTALPPSSPNHVEDDCALMKLLRLKFHRFHRFLICDCGGGSFLQLGALLSHMRLFHPQWLIGEAQKPPATRWDLGHKRTFEAQVVTHLSSSLGILVDQESQVFTEAILQGPIFGLRDAEKRPQCPSCLQCFKNRSTASSHYAAKHSTRAAGGTAFSELPAIWRWCQQPYYTRVMQGKQQQYIIVPGQLPVVAAAMRTPPSNAEKYAALPYIGSDQRAGPIPHWLVRLQWVVWFESLLKSGWTTSQLLALIAPTRGREKDKFPKGSCTRRKRLNWVLSRISKRLVTMAEDANIWLKTSSPETRGALSEGYVILSPPFIAI